MSQSASVVRRRTQRGHNWNDLGNRYKYNLRFHAKSSGVHALPSVQSVKRHKQVPSGWQRSTVQASPSLQSSHGTCFRAPSIPAVSYVGTKTQVSVSSSHLSIVHGLPSLQSVFLVHEHSSGLAGSHCRHSGSVLSDVFKHSSVVALHVSRVHGSSSSHRVAISSGVPLGSHGTQISSGMVMKLHFCVDISQIPKVQMSLSPSSQSASVKQRATSDCSNRLPASGQSR